MEWFQLAVGGLAGACVAGGAAFEFLYRSRDTKTIGLALRGRNAWKELPSPDGKRRFALSLPFVNANRHYEQTLVDVRPHIRLLTRESVTEEKIDASVRIKLVGEEGRSDGYWAANLLGPEERCEVEIIATVSGAPEALFQLHAAVVTIAYDTYGRVALQHFEEEVVLPLAAIKPMPEAIFGVETMIQCIPTPLLTDADDIVDVIDTYTRDIRQPGDIVAVAESVVAITQRRYFKPNEVNPGFWAKRLCFFVPSKGSLSSRHGFQVAMNEVGAFKMVAAFFIGALGKLVGRKGLMYEVAGRPAELIDDITGTMPPFDKYIVAGPAQPQEAVNRIKQRTSLDAAIVDANDLKRAMVLAVTPGLEPEKVSRLLRDNPFGNAAEQTPIVLLRPLGAGAKHRTEGQNAPTPALQ